jgi:tetratricopeptide (TPR) repeat protein
MVALAPDRKAYRLEQVYATTNLGTVQIDTRQYRRAAATYQASLAAAETLAAAEPNNLDYQKQVIAGLAWLADAHEYSGSIDQALAERERQLRLLGALEQLSPRDAEVHRDAMTSHRAIGRLQAARGDAAGGLSALRRSVAMSEALLRIEPDNTEWLQAIVGARFDLAELLLALGQVGEAGSVLRSGCDTTGRLAARDSSVSHWKSRLMANCLTLRARLALAENKPAQAFDLAAQAAAAANSSPKPAERHLLRFSALAVGGLASARLGDAGRSVRLWRGAVAALPKDVEFRPSELQQLAQLHELLGNAAGAQKVSSVLAAMGYRYPNSANGRA